ncbi:MAG TPA: ATP-binding protein [Labilithrix sp.]|nr:ATP-binding protein [Labilithrix sp.]
MGSETIDRLRVELERLAPSWANEEDLAVRLYELLGLFVAGTPDFMILVSPDGTIRYINRVRPGVTLEDVVGRNLFDYFLPSLREKTKSSLLRVAATGQAEVGEDTATYSDGTKHTFTTRFAPILERGSVVAVAVVATEITASRVAEAALRESEDKLRITVAATGMGLWEWDIKTNVVRWDDAMCRIWGVTQETFPSDYASYIATIHPDERQFVSERVAKALDTGIYSDFEHRIVRPDGTHRYLLSKGAVTRGADGSFAKFIGGCLDITERREAEERQRQSQKLEAVGQLSAGIAHNFNNLLMGILPNLELAMEESNAHTRELLEAAQGAALRAAELVRQLTTFAGRARPAPRRPEDIRELVERTMGICRRAFDRRIELIATLPGEPMVVVGDPTMLEQALLNILINARDALTEAKVEAPAVRIEVARISASADELRKHELSWPGDGVSLRIVDNGPGMSEQTRRRVYEPFFTTKDVGKGTGLGLSTSLAIVKDHGGAIDCASEPGHGTTFTLYLPSSDARAAAAENKRTEPDTTRRENLNAILVVDDEEAVRSPVERMLQRAGYKVYSAAGGREALELLADAAVLREVTLVLLDLSMPGMPGSAVRREIRALAPLLPVAYFTGYALDSAEDADGVVEKPVGYAQLTTAVREILARKAGR